MLKMWNSGVTKAKYAEAQSTLSYANNFKQNVMQ